jgi:anti-anti-sigma factor
MAINIRTSAGVTILDLRGKLTADRGVEELLSKVKELLGLELKRILLNLAGVSYVDSMGIESFVTCYKSALDCGGQLKFSSPSDQLRRLLSMTKLSTVLDVHETEAAAIASFG